MTPSQQSDTSRSPIVVGVDGSAGARAALRYALGAAAARAAGLDVVACFAVDPCWPALHPGGAPSVDTIRADVTREARAQVAAVLAGRPPGSPVPPVHLEVTQGAPSDVLVQRGRGAALLVVGSRGRAAVRAALMGSVALHCVMHGPCPVLVVHPAPARSEATLSGAPPA